jgi:flagella basal body P-ring formation protein FlgA
MIVRVSVKSVLLSLGLPIVLFCAFANAQTASPQSQPLDLDLIHSGNPALDYSLRLNSRCTVSTPLIRLRDIATPVGPTAAWWQRAGGVVIAMMPVEGGEMVIQRDRLAVAIDQDKTLPPIDWSGADAVKIVWQAPSSRSNASVVDSSGAADSSIHVTGGLAIASVGADSMRIDKPHQTGDSYTQPASAQSSTAQQVNVSAKVAVLAELPELNPQDADRIVRLIDFAIDRADQALRNSYDITVDPGQYALRPLADVRRIDRIEFLSRPAEGTVEAKIFGANTRQQVSQTIHVHFETRPMVVVPRENLRRGQVVTAADLTLTPAPRGIPTDSLIKSIDDAVDMQVVNALQKDRPFTHASITRPVLIERGDLIEIHVVGGGVTVATNGRSLSRGAAGDLIAVETLEPRKKIIARVSRPGLVEVFTRPPRVR